MLSELSRYVVAGDCDPTNVYHRFISESYPWLEETLTYSHALGALTQVGIEFIKVFLHSTIE